MLESALKALAQMGSPRFRTVLLKSAGLAILVLVVLGIVVHRVLAWLAQSGGAWLNQWLGANWSGWVGTFETVLAIAVGAGIVFAAIFLMPAVTALVAGVFADEIAEEVERTHYPDQPVGTALPLWRAILEGVRTAGLALLVYAAALALLLTGIGAVVFFVASSYLLGREYFLLAAMRYRTADEAKAMRQEHGRTVMTAGMLITAFVSIPIVNLATPLFGTALMVHLHKRLSAPRLAGRR